MRFTLIVHGAFDSALAFARAVINSDHHVQSVFLYHEGVLLAQRGREHPLATAWQELAQAHDFPLQLCISAGERRGLEEQAANILPGFEVVGLGQLVEALAMSDRTVTFGAPA